MDRRWIVTLAATALGLVACQSQTEAPPADPSPPVFGGARPLTQLKVPSSYDPARPVPLVIQLHGSGSNGYQTDLVTRLSSIVDARGFILAAPEGTVDKVGQQFWNATEACCDFGHTGVDDVAYLLGLVKELRAAYSIDAKRIYVLGLSNGGFMSLRLACDAADVFAAVIDIAGASWADVGRCAPKVPVATLHLHGTADDLVPYDGGPTSDPAWPGLVGDVPSVAHTVAAWVAYDGCDSAADETSPPMRIDFGFPTPQTFVTKYHGCKPGGAVELWTERGSAHIVFDTTPDFPSLLYAWLDAHARP